MLGLLTGSQPLTIPVDREEVDLQNVALTGEGTGDAARGAGLLAVAAAVADGLVHGACLAADLDAEVADVALHALHFAPGVERDVGVLVGLHHARREDALRAVQGGEGL